MLTKMSYFESVSSITAFRAGNMFLEHDPWGRITKLAGIHFNVFFLTCPGMTSAFVPETFTPAYRHARYVASTTALP